MEEKIPEDTFIRIHRSFIVAIDKIKSYTSNFVEINKDKVPIGRLYLQHTSGVLKKYFQQ